MLVLSRKPGEKIQIGPNIWVTVVRIGPNTVRLGIEAPTDMHIVREELIVHGDTPQSTESNSRRSRSTETVGSIGPSQTNNSE